MELSKYQEEVQRTVGHQDVAMFGLGIAGEAGELVDGLKKQRFHGHPVDKAHLLEEVGDVLWYLSALCSFYGLSLSEATDANIKKLRARYPNGFSETRSQTR